jgi:hypothetical protein
MKYRNKKKHAKRCSDWTKSVGDTLWLNHTLPQNHIFVCSGTQVVKLYLNHGDENDVVCAGSLHDA